MPAQTTMVAAGQPCFAPTLSYFQKIADADIFLLTDDLQYSSHAQMNRCRIKTRDGAAWLTIPVEQKGKGQQILKDVRISNGMNWQKNHWKTLHVNYKSAPYFEKYDLYLEKIYRREWRFLVDFNQVFIDLALQELRITTPVKLSSRFACNLKGTDRLIFYMDQLGCTSYLCHENEKAFTNATHLSKAQKELTCRNYAHPRYYQLFADFIPNLSVLDFLFNEGNESAQILAG